MALNSLAFAAPKPDKLRSLGIMALNGMFDEMDGVSVLRQAVTEDVADRGLFGSVAADGDLVELGALLFDAQNADVADMVVAAGIDAARDLDLEIADLALPLRRLELPRQFLRQGDRPRVGQRAEVEARACDHIGDETGVAGRKTGLDQRVVHLAQIAHPDVR